MSDFVVITGLSGAGRSQAANDLEDLGWFVIDNLPPRSSPRWPSWPTRPARRSSGWRWWSAPAPTTRTSSGAIDELRPRGARVAHAVPRLPRPRCWSAATRSTRRRHPLLSRGEGLAEAIERERPLLEPVRAKADVVIDTSDAQRPPAARPGRRRCSARPTPTSGCRSRVVSFGFKHGLPARRRPGARLPVPARTRTGSTSCGR